MCPGLQTARPVMPISRIRPAARTARTALLLLLLLLAGAGLGACRRDRHGGRGAVEWARDVRARDSSRREAAVRAFRSLGRRGRPATAALHESARHPAPEVRAAALRALAALGADADTVMYTLTRALATDSVTLVRLVAADGLEELMQEAKGGHFRLGLRALAGALVRDPDPTVRATAASNLGALEERAEPAADALRAALRDPDTLVRHEARDALAHVYGRPHR